MVAFGKRLKERQIQEWERYYIKYKLMKKKVKHYSQQIQDGAMEPQQVLNEFSNMLDNEIEKIVLFLLERQGFLSIRLSKLGKEYTSPNQQPSICEHEICELQEAYRGVGQDVLKLLFYVEVNAIGLRKILKKFDKRFGYRFTDYYVKTRANNPYSHLQQISKHVGLGAIVGAITRNLGDLQECQGSNYLSIYDQPNLPLQDPVVDSINGAIERLIESTNFLAQHEPLMQEKPLSLHEGQVDDQGGHHFVSFFRNLANTFMCMVSTYSNLWCR